jgi:hypothetical protein
MQKGQKPAIINSVQLMVGREFCRCVCRQETLHELLCAAGAVVAVNVGMVFCCARLACLKLTGQDLDPLATEAAQQAHATVLEAGEAGGGPGGGTAAGGPRIEITAVTHPNMEVCVFTIFCLEHRKSPCGHLRPAVVLRRKV